MTVRDLLEALSMTDAQAAILEPGGTWRVEGRTRLSREDARRLLSDESEEAAQIAESDVGMVSFCRDLIHVIYRPGKARNAIQGFSGSEG